jgi:DNA-binding NarL/FixJ family response regulator
MATSNMVRNLVLPKLAMMDDIALAGLADNPGNALKMLVQEHPEIVILDMDFGGPFVGLDTARMMQKTRVRAAIAMLVPELDPEALRKQARKFGSSWSYVKKTTAGRVDILETVLKSAVRGVQWVEPDLSRSLAVLWKIAEQARELENRHIDIDPSTFASSKSLKARKFSEPQTDAAPGEDESDPEWDEDDVALGIKTMSTSGPDTGGVNITSVSVGHGDVGQNVGKVRRNRRTG